MPLVGRRFNDRNRKSMTRVYIPAMALLFACNLFAADRPNVVVIMADDLGYADVGFQGCKDISTQHIVCTTQIGRMKRTKRYSGFVIIPIIMVTIMSWR